MYIIVAGCRKVGSNLSILLSEQGHDVAVIDNDPENFEALGSGFNGITIAGIPIDEDILRSAGIENADCLAAVTNDDNMNMMIAQIARMIFHVPKVITRVYDPKRSEVFQSIGLNTICPTMLAVHRIRSFLTDSEDSIIYDFFGTDIQFTTVSPTKRQVGRIIADVNDPSIFGLIRSGKFLQARPDYVIKDKDLLVVAN